MGKCKLDFWEVMGSKVSETVLFFSFLLCMLFSWSEVSTFGEIFIAFE